MQDTGRSCRTRGGCAGGAVVEVLAFCVEFKQSKTKQNETNTTKQGAGTDLESRQRRRPQGGRLKQRLSRRPFNAGAPGSREASIGGLVSAEDLPWASWTCFLPFSSVHTALDENKKEGFISNTRDWIKFINKSRNYFSRITCLIRPPLSPSQI